MILNYFSSILLCLAAFYFEYVLCDVGTVLTGNADQRKENKEDLKVAESASPSADRAGNCAYGGGQPKFLGNIGNWLGGNGGYRPSYPNNINRPGSYPNYGGYYPPPQYWGNAFGNGYSGGYGFYPNGQGNYYGSSGYGGTSGYGGSSGYGGNPGYGINSGYGGYGGYGNYGGYGGNGNYGGSNGYYWGNTGYDYGTGYGSTGRGGYYPNNGRNYNGGYNNQNGYSNAPYKK